VAVIKKCPSTYSTLGTNSLPEEPVPTVIKPLAILKKFESDDILYLGNILRLKYVMVENTPSFPDLSLIF
jgi:hypothetical protein